MKLIFLDFDGVINSHEYMFFNREKWESRDDSEMIDSDALILLNKIIEETEAKVVISSSWRLHFEIEELKGFLSKKGFIGEVIDKTSDGFWIDKENHISSQRGHEIQKWLYEHSKSNIESFVILDDNSDMVHLMPYLVQTTWQYGLQEEHVRKAIEILNRKTNG